MRRGASSNAPHRTAHEQRGASGAWAGYIHTHTQTQRIRLRRVDTRTERYSYTYTALRARRVYPRTGDGRLRRGADARRYTLTEARTRHAGCARPIDRALHATRAGVCAALAAARQSTSQRQRARTGAFHRRIADARLPAAIPSQHSTQAPRRLSTEKPSWGG